MGTTHWLAVLLFCLPFQFSEYTQMSKEIKKKGTFKGDYVIL